MNGNLSTGLKIAALLAAAALTGCSGSRNQARNPAGDRPFPLGAVSDAHWETQETNAQAAKFIFHDQEFVGDTAELAPSAKKHLMEVALRLEHVPFPVVIEESQYDRNPELDQKRRRTVVEQLGRLGVVNVEDRVVVANSFAEGFTAIEGESAYYSTLNGTVLDGGAGRRGAGGFGTFR
ncbi:MAG TPA: hypothetical protein VFE24_08630 [Pirellulales bacterium]|jgi:hypothetical protein|nr:hypothetical protein [Pirellulales bacterium]